MKPNFQVCDYCIRQRYQTGMSGVIESHYVDKNNCCHEVQKAKWQVYEYLMHTTKDCVCPMQYRAWMENDTDLVVPDDCPYQTEHAVSG